MRCKTIFLVSLMFGLTMACVMPAYSTTYYVRTDGGTATQCTGLTDAAYPGSGTAKACAFNHPFWAIAPIGNNPTKLVGGDTLIIDGSNGAQYQIGYGAPNTSDTSYCSPSWPWDCYMRPIPSGPDPAHPTRILGKGWDAECANPPQLWGRERAGYILNMQGTDNTEIQCLEVTDHAACQVFGKNYCNDSSFPYGDWAKTGLVAWDSENVLLKNVNIHGLYRGVWAGRLKDWTIDNVDIVANSFVGWDGDIGAFQSSNSGAMTFNKVKIEYNGCGETYPGNQPYNCYSQTQGGYGDGLGTHETAGDWYFTNCNFSHNVSDGLDLLYHDGSGKVTIKRSRFEGNAGNQVKTATNTEIENSIMIGNCAYFNQKPITWDSPTFDSCRALGNTVSVKVKRSGMQVKIYNSTLTSNGDSMIMSAGDNCTGSEKVISRNNILYGGSEFLTGAEDKADIYYASGSTGNGDGSCGSLPFDDDYSVIWNTKHFSSDCSNRPHSTCEDPKFSEPAVQYYSGNTFNANLQSASPARDKAAILAGLSSLDYNNYDRGGVWDVGSLEYGSVPQGEAPQEPTCADGIQYCTTQNDCQSYGYYWYNNTCNAQAQPKTCADGVQYCTTQAACTGQGYYWYNNTCNAQAQPKTCADGIQYCTTQAACTGQGYYWYNNTCNAQAQPKTCADGIQYCTTQAACTGQGYYWYNNTCNAQAQPKTCADGIQYCTTQAACTGQGYYWYNNTCNAQAQPKTCADGIQYCTTQAACTGQGYYWYNNTCNAQAQPKTCADGIQYCTTQAACTGQGYYWYNNTCNAQAQPKTCADGIQYCTTQAACTGQGHYWYNNTCNAQAQPKTCAEDIEYCTTQAACTGQGYYWYNYTCNAQAQPKTCADGIEYCTTQSVCTGQGYYWYNNTCNVNAPVTVSPTSVTPTSSTQTSDNTATRRSRTRRTGRSQTQNSQTTTSSTPATVGETIKSSFKSAFNKSGSTVKPVISVGSGSYKPRGKDILMPKESEPELLPLPARQKQSSAGLTTSTSAEVIQTSSEVQKPPNAIQRWWRRVIDWVSSFKKR